MDCLIYVLNIYAEYRNYWYTIYASGNHDMIHNVLNLLSMIHNIYVQITSQILCIVYCIQWNFPHLIIGETTALADWIPDTGYPNSVTTTLLYPNPWPDRTPCPYLITIGEKLWRSYCNAYRQTSSHTVNKLFIQRLC